MEGEREEKVEEKSFGSSHVMQVIYADDVGRSQTVYLQCKVRPVEGTVGRGIQESPSPPVGHVRYFRLCVSSVLGSHAQMRGPCLLWASICSMCMAR